MPTTQELTIDALDAAIVGETYVWTYRKTAHTVRITKLSKHIIFCTSANGDELEINR